MKWSFPAQQCGLAAAASRTCMTRVRLTLFIAAKYGCMENEAELHASNQIVDIIAIGAHVCINVFITEEIGTKLTTPIAQRNSI